MGAKTADSRARRRLRGAGAPVAARLGLASGLGAGAVLALLAGVSLWASEGARVFAEAAFAAVLACF
jgi:hypothetical protein